MHTIRFLPAQTHTLQRSPTQTAVFLESAQEVVRRISMKSAPLKIFAQRPKRHRPPNTLFFDDTITSALPSLSPTHLPPVSFSIEGQVTSSIRLSAPAIEVQAKRRRAKSEETGPRTLFFDESLWVRLPDLGLAVASRPLLSPPPTADDYGDPYRGAMLPRSTPQEKPSPPALPQPVARPLQTRRPPVGLLLVLLGLVALCALWLLR